MRINRIMIFFAVLATAIILNAFINIQREKKIVTKPTNPKGFVLLELFTSEGCNSCPPAEKLIEKLGREFNDKSVYVLNYHVDYFDYLGWKDVYGSSENTKRQKQYSQWLKTQVYTPQLVVNGRQEFIGSDEIPIRGAILNELSTTQENFLNFKISKNLDDLTINCEIKDIQPNDELLFALVQKQATTDVLRGENAGLKFSHSQIVRKTLSVPVKDAINDSVHIKLPKNASSAGWEVIGFLQNRNSGKISAVNMSIIP